MVPEPVSGVGPAIRLAQERTGPSLPSLHLRGELGDDWAPNVHTGLRLTEVKAAIVNVCPTKLDDILPALAGVEIKHHALADLASELLVRGDYLRIGPRLMATVDLVGLHPLR